jgi:hypothetical protein
VIVISAVRGDGVSRLLGELAKILELGLHGSSSDDKKVPEYLDGEPPEQLPLSDLSMETLEMRDDEDG